MKKQSKVLVYSFFVNIILVIIKLLVGTIGKSKAVIADGIHSLSDLMTDLFGIIGIKFALSKADKTHPFGHGKIEYLISIGIGLIVLFLGIGLLKESIYGKITIPENFVIYGIIGTIIFKYILSQYIIKKGNEYNSNILISSGLESRTDVYSSVLVLITFIGSKLTKFNNVFKYSDKVGGIIVGVFVLHTGYKILKENIISILGIEEDDIEYLSEINENIALVDEVLSINSVSIQKYGTYNKAIIEVGVNPELKVSEAHKIAHRVEQGLLKGNFRISYVTVHIESFEEKE